jgi:hypothetical protein
VNDGVVVEVIHGCHDAISELLFRCDVDVSQDGTGEFGKKPSMRLNHDPCFGVKVNSKRCAG